MDIYLDTLHELKILFFYRTLFESIQLERIQLIHQLLKFGGKTEAILLACRDGQLRTQATPSEVEEHVETSAANREFLDSKFELSAHRFKLDIPKGGRLRLKRRWSQETA